MAKKVKEFEVVIKAAGVCGEQITFYEVYKTKSMDEALKMAREEYSKQYLVCEVFPSW